MNSAKLQIGRTPAQTLHTSTLANVYENPLMGFSDGERQKRLYQK